MNGIEVNLSFSYTSKPVNNFVDSSRDHRHVGFILTLMTFKYSEIPLLRSPKIKTSYLFKTLLQSLSYSFLHFLHPVYLWLETTFGTVQKWSLRPLLDSSKGGLNIGILL